MKAQQQTTPTKEGLHTQGYDLGYKDGYFAALNEVNSKSEFLPADEVLNIQTEDCEVHKQRHSGIGNVGYGYAILKPLINKEGEYKGQRGGYHVIAHQDLRLTKEQADEICNSINSCYKKLPRFYPGAEVPIPSEEHISKAVNERQALLDSHRELLDALEKLYDRCKDKGTAVYMYEEIEASLKNAKQVLKEAGLSE